jgi:hypothetical protein
MWIYFIAYHGESPADEQDFAYNAKYAFENASKMKDPVFVDVSGETCEYPHEYVVIYDRGTMPEDTDWNKLVHDEEMKEDEEEE